MTRAETTITWLMDALASSRHVGPEGFEAARASAAESSAEDAHVIGVLMTTLILAQRDELPGEAPSSPMEARAFRAALRAAEAPAAHRTPALARAVEALLAHRWERGPRPETRVIRRAARAASTEDRGYLEHLMRAA